jgi:hypothetical protein
VIINDIGINANKRKATIRGERLDLTPKELIFYYSWRVTLVTHLAGTNYWRRYGVMLLQDMNTPLHRILTAFE